MSTKILNPSIYSPGSDITGQATADVTARRFLRISGNRTAKGVIAVAHATAAGRVCGVSGDTALNGELVLVVRGNSRCVWITADGAITAGAEVEVGTAGKAKAKASGVAVGYAINGAADGADAEISLY